MTERRCLVQAIEGNPAKLNGSLTKRLRLVSHREIISTVRARRTRTPSKSRVHLPSQKLKRHVPLQRIGIIRSSGTR